MVGQMQDFTPSRAFRVAGPKAFAEAGITHSTGARRQNLGLPRCRRHVRRVGHHHYVERAAINSPIPYYSAGWDRRADIGGQLRGTRIKRQANDTNNSGLDEVKMRGDYGLNLGWGDSRSMQHCPNNCLQEASQSWYMSAPLIGVR